MLEPVNIQEEFSHITPIEAVVGFRVAEQTYDKLNMREQLIIDLLCAGFTQTEIAWLFGLSQPSINASIRRIRFALAESELRMALVDKLHLRIEMEKIANMRGPLKVDYQVKGEVIGEPDGPGLTNIQEVL